MSSGVTATTGHPRPARAVDRTTFQAELRFLTSRGDTRGSLLARSMAANVINNAKVAPAPLMTVGEDRPRFGPSTSVNTSAVSPSENAAEQGAPTTSPAAPAAPHTATARLRS